MKKFMCYICIFILVFTCIPIYAVNFNDLNANHWAYNNIMKLTNEGVINGYQDGTFRPENMVTYGEFMKLIMCMYIPESDMIDVDVGHWAYKYVLTAEEFELIPGSSIQLGDLDKPITRMEMVKFLAIIDKNLNRDITDETVVLDFVDTEHLMPIYKSYLKRVVSKGYILGNPDKTFKPESNLTRAEMVTILTRL